MRVPESVPVRLAGFAAMLVVVLGASYALGDAVGPVGPGVPDGHSSEDAGHDDGSMQ